MLAVLDSPKVPFSELLTFFSTEGTPFFSSIVTSLTAVSKPQSEPTLESTK